MKCLSLSGRKLNQLSVCCCADVFLPCPDNLLVNLHECRDMVIELLNQLPGLFEGNHETGNALGTALQAAFKLMVGQSYSLSFCLSLRSFACVVLVFFLGSWFLFLCVCVCVCGVCLCSSYLKQFSQEQSFVRLPSLHACVYHFVYKEVAGKCS